MKTTFFKSAVFALFFALAGFGVYEISSVDTSTAASGTKLNQNQLPSTAIKSIKVTLDSTKMRNLVASPVRLIPAPGAGKIIMPLVAYAIGHDSGMIPYNTGGGATDMVLFYGDTLGNYVGSFQPACKSTWNHAVNEFGIFCTQPPSARGLGDEVVAYENLPLSISHADNYGEYGVGNFSVDIYIQYLEISIN